MIKFIAQWFRHFSLYRVKVSMFVALVTAVSFDIAIKVDLLRKSFEYSNGSLTIQVLSALILIFIFLICSDIWLERIKSKERISKDILKTIRKAKIPLSLKEEMVDFLKKDF